MNRYTGFYIISIFFFSQSVFATLPPNLSKKLFRLQTELEYFSTDANFDDLGGSFERLSQGQSYKNISLRFGGFYSFSRRWAFSTHLKFANATSQSLDFERSNTQFKEVAGQMYYQILTQPFEFISSGEIIVPFNKIEVDTDDVMTGEGALELAANFWFVKPIYSLNPYIHLGYRYRDEGRSHLGTYALGTDLTVGEVFIGGELYGYQSVTDDEFTETPIQRTTITDRVNGSSLIYYSINPSQLAARAWLGLDLTKRTYFYFGLNQSIDGKNSASGLGLYTGLEIGLDMFQSEESPRKKRRQREKDDFNIEAENYDERLFDKNFQRKQRKTKIKEKKQLNELEKQLESQ